MLYIRRIFHQDATHQMTADRDGSKLFFQYDYSNSPEDRFIDFRFVDYGNHSDQDGKIIKGILHPDSSESRINGEFKGYVFGTLKAEEKDFLLIWNTNDINKYNFTHIAKGNPLYSSLELLTGNKNHMISIDSEVDINGSNSVNNYSRSSVSSSYRPYITAIKSKPFLLLAGISGTGKSRIVREWAFQSCPDYLQDEDRTSPGNYCMIEVKPNWHDSSELLGYYSNISQKYIYTKFVKFLVKAMMFPEVPFFVCLDEMNLAPVEQYFAEFLSVLETRKRGDDGHIHTDYLVGKDFFKSIYEMEPQKDANGNDIIIKKEKKKDPSDFDWFAELQDLKENAECNALLGKVSMSSGSSLRDKGLCLPENVFIIGTVNMDDTTHQFSRKVIDRAMTIEMNGGNLMAMFGGSKDLDYPAGGPTLKLENIRPLYVTADEALKDRELAEQIKVDTVKQLDAINDILKGTPFLISYRVLNELVIYLCVLLDNGEPYEDALAQAVDQILLMKILPRIEGDRDMFEYKDGSSVKNRLEELLALAPEIKETPVATEKAEETDTEDDTSTDEDDQKTNGKAEKQTSRKKLQEMIDRLNQSEFTRFWP